MKKIIFPTITLLLFLQACNIINPKEPIPHFLQIDSVQMVGNPNQIYPIGSLSKKITDVWVYYDNQLLGAYELPARVPIINTGDGNIDIRAGIWNNGLSATRTPYFFYKAYNTKINFDAGTVKKIVPQIMYGDSARLFASEDFEQGSNFINNTGSDTSVQRTSNTSDVFEGGYSGKISLDTAKSTSISIFNTKLYFNKYRTYYLELNYKCTMPFEIYMNFSSAGTYTSKLITGVNTRSAWNKIYIDLSTFVQNNTADNGCLLSFYSVLPSDSASGTILIDNLKIVSSAY